jgi:hypothetical protein
MTNKKIGYEHFYKDSRGNRRRSGIFAPGIDRFILIDDYDFWMTFETAELISSKVPTVAYILPPTDFELTNANCIGYTIFNKTKQRIGPSPISIARQNPQLKFLFDYTKITFSDIPEDYKTDDRRPMLTKLQEWADYVHNLVYVINMTEALFNPFNNKDFVQKYANPQWLAGLKSKVDRSATENGVFFEIRHALYMANNIEDAELRILNIWKDHYHEQQYMLHGFYKIWNRPVPEELADVATYKPETVSTFIV